MNLDIRRIWPSAQATVGALYVDEESDCYSLEPGSEGKGPIPAGTYDVKLLPSAHFQESEDPWVKRYASQMPHLQNVPGRTHIMIHWGDDPEDTEGCVLVGNRRMSDFMIGDSRNAFAALYIKITNAFAHGELVSISISDNGRADEVWPNS
jgi:hypothetical protein